MDYDDLLTNHLGEFGLYQRIIFLLTSLGAIAGCYANLSIVFIAAVPDHWCRVPEIEDFTKLDRKNISIPQRKNDAGDKVYSSCEMYQRDYSNLTYEIDSFSNKDETRYCKRGWEYDKTIYTSSIVTEGLMWRTSGFSSTWCQRMWLVTFTLHMLQWDLVCDDIWLRTTVVSVFMAGFMVGVIISGSFSDTFGRKKTMFVSILGMTAFSIGLAFATSYYMFLVFRFIIAAFAIATFTCGFVMVVELVGPKWRLHTGTMIEYFWAIGYMSLAGIAYLIRDWRNLQLAIGVPMGALLLLYWIVPESPRWLYMKSRHDEADAIVHKMAKMNKRQLPKDYKIDIQQTKNGFIWDLFRIKKLRMRTINICFNWCVNSLVYYGLSLNTSSLSGDPYLNFFISGAVEVPAYIFVQLNPLCCGRRIPLSGTMILAGAALLATLLPHGTDWLNVALAMFGKFAISASFAIIYIFTAELYPTQVRNVAVASGSFFARIGGILAPYIAQLGTVNNLIPIIIFGVGSLVAGGLALLLPETKGKHLPETLQELQEKKDVTSGKSGSYDVSVFTNASFKKDEEQRV